MASPDRAPSVAPPPADNPIPEGFSQLNASWLREGVSCKLEVLPANEGAAVRKALANMD